MGINDDVMLPYCTINIMQAGVMAKILSKNPNYTPAQLKQYLLATYVATILCDIYHV